MRHRNAALFAYLLFAAILCAAPAPGSAQESKLAQASAPALLPAKTATPLRVATWNVHDCSSTDRKSGETLLFHPRIAATLKELRIDVIAFQEVQIEVRKGADIALLKSALDDAGWPMPYLAWAKGPQSDDLAIFSRYPIEMSRPILDPKGKDWPRPALEVRVVVDGTPLYVFNAHFKAYDEARSLGQRLAQARALASHLREEFGGTLNRAAIVVAGDFNTVSPYDMQPGGTLDILQLRDNSGGDDDFLDLNMKWRYFSPTYSSSRYSSVTDHLIVSPALAKDSDQASIRVLDAPDSGRGFPISDHKLLVFSFTLAPQRQSAR